MDFEKGLAVQGTKLICTEGGGIDFEKRKFWENAFKNSFLKGGMW